ncbi:MAG: hypothetical protein REI96_22060 [Flavobacterium nitrogenifigens]|uniref:Uncharacterized protein n=1 Tax=Flavobacterium nitrogenifigens TaxID=1617283 RepID=A0A521BEN4_9FLAO|nr:hypothetical protein [Flavobacterium nitrogenifigens]KAF2337488.1 hypothetical protein DM397_04605 [Flavobacterium nitrogenifigens]MDQ8015147.1 hypothetical protein [Flavobacterium nitrogenifigens]SMO45544.1 hypothetical protein SAMN06265220_101934 [Flavobacterium nitrogenifigens]
MKKIIIFILVISFSCKNRKEKLEYLICKDSVQYWNYEWPRERANYHGFTFSFDKNGKVTKYSFSKVKNKRWIFSDIPDTSIYRWEITNDSILIVMGTKKKIIRYTEDTIYAIDIESNENVYYTRVKGNLHIEKFPKIKIIKDDSLTGKKVDIKPLNI